MHNNDKTWSKILTQRPQTKTFAITYRDTLLPPSSCVSRQYWDQIFACTLPLLLLFRKDCTILWDLWKQWPTWTTAMNGNASYIKTSCTETLCSSQRLPSSNRKNTSHNSWKQWRSPGIHNSSCSASGVPIRGEGSRASSVSSSIFPVRPEGVHAAPQCCT